MSDEEISLQLLIDQVDDGKLIRDFINNSRVRGGERQSLTVWKTRKELLQSYWDSFRSRHKQLLKYKEICKDKDYFKLKQFLDVEENYVQAMASITEVTEEPPITTAPPNQTTSIPLSMLPKVPLPKFSGKQLEWETFKEMFESRVKNVNTIEPIVKLQHLISCIEGDAARRLSNMKIIGTNLDVAWDILMRRYDNKRIRLTAQLNRLISVPASSPKCHGEITRLLDTFEEGRRALRALNRPVESWDDWFVQLLVSKLDISTRDDWEKSIEATDEFPTYDQLSKFLENRARTQDATQPLQESQSSFKPKQQNRPSNAKGPKQNKSMSAHNTSTLSTKKKSITDCSLCGSKHYLSKCPEFLQMTQSKKIEHVGKAALCNNCLTKGHSTDSCSSPHRCYVCNEKHHTKLHTDGITASTVDESNPLRSAHSSHITPDIAQGFTASRVSTVLMATALITLSSKSEILQVRALIDPGAEESFVTEHVAQRLKLRKLPVKTFISGVGGEVSAVSNYQVNLSLVTSQNLHASLSFSALVLNKVTNLLPRQEVENRDWPHLRGLTLADPSYFNPSRIDCILGSDVYAAILLEGETVRKGPANSPTAQNTMLGWILFGRTETPSCVSKKVIMSHHASSDESLKLQLQQFWEVEEISSARTLTPAEEECEKHFLETHYRDAEGRFVVRLPFSRTAEFPGSRSIAKTRFLQTESRMRKDSKLSSAYLKFMQEYLDLGHMEPAPDDTLCEMTKTFYMPHHGIFKRDGSDKIRVVFNASQRSKGGYSLNDCLHTGPKLQKDLYNILTR